MPANLENSAVATGLEKVSFHSNPKEQQYQRMFKLPYNCTHFTCQQDYAQNPSSQASTVWDQELPDVQAGFRKGRGIRDQISNIHWLIEKAREFQNNIYFCFIDQAKAIDCVDHNKLWKMFKEVEIPDHLICLLRNLYAGQEATVRTGHGTTDWLKIGKGVHKVSILSHSLFNLYAEYIMQNAWLDEAQMESRLLREVSIASDMQMTAPLWQKVKQN